MANVLLLSPDEDALASLAVQLRRMGHAVRCMRCWPLNHIDADCRFVPEIVAIDVTNLIDRDWPALRQFCQSWNSCSSPVLILCWSRIWRGPRFVLEIERLGARFVYGS